MTTDNNIFDIDHWANMSDSQPNDNVKDNRDNRDKKDNRGNHGNQDNRDNLGLAQAIARQLTLAHTDITQGYEQWYKLAFALADGIGEGGRAVFHDISRLNSQYRQRECDNQYNAAMRSHGHGITFATFIHMVREAGVDIAQARHEAEADTAQTTHKGNEKYDKMAEKRKEAENGTEKFVPRCAIVPSGTNDKENENTHYYNGNTCNNALVPSGTMAQRGTNSTSGYTFSDKLKPGQLPKCLTPMTEKTSGSVYLDMQILGTLNVVSGLLGGAAGTADEHSGIYGIYDGRRVYAPLYNIIFGTAGSSKGDMVFCKLLAQPVKTEMRRAYEAQKAQYDTELAAWESKSRGKQRTERGPAPKEPPFRTPFVPGNSSSSAVYRALDANGGWGLMFETEADTITQMLTSDYGNYSDLLRRAFHHESVSMTRTGEKLHIDIDEPRLSVLLTCTPGQLPGLFPSFENGLGSRFLFYSLPEGDVEFHNVFANADSPLEDVYRRLGEQLLPLYHSLQQRKQHPLQFVMSMEQQREFIGFYGDVLGEQFSMLGSNIKAFVFRLALSCFRYAMTLTALRRLSEWQESGEAFNRDIFDSNEQAIVCDDRDFRTAMTITGCLVNHTARVYAVLAKADDNPFDCPDAKMTNDEARLYRELPQGEQVSTAEIIATAQQLEISKRTAYRMLNRFCNIYRTITPTGKRGIYRIARQTEAKEQADNTTP